METEDNLNIVLVGMMGAGKSYIGTKLAKLLAHFTFADTDDEIEKLTGQTIAEIFESRGENYFRKLETKAIKKISLKKNQIISIGGGAFTKSENIKLLKGNCLTFYLKAPARELFNRIKNETHRPLLGNDFSEQTVEALLNKRQKYYMKADFIIDTLRPSYAIIDNILGEYENYVKQRTPR